MNLGRSERFKLENVMLVGIISGRHEPKLTITSYLQPYVAELNLLWKDEITVRALGALTSEVYHAALFCVGCDVRGVVLQDMDLAKVAQSAQNISRAQ